MSGDVIIIGGGAAGLSAAVSLVSNGFKVTLLESRPFLGGRMYSFKEPVTGAIVDNGQHLLTGFYYNTFKFLSIINTSQYVARQRSLYVNFREKGGREYSFSTPRLPSPFHFLVGLLRYKKFPKKDVWKLITKSKLLKKAAAPNLTAYDYLKSLDLSDEAIDLFFTPLVLATLNSKLDRVSGELFRKMLVSVLSSNLSDSVLSYSTVPFSKLMAEPVEKFITENGSCVLKSHRVADVKFENDRVSRIVTNDGKEFRGDCYIFSVLPNDLEKIIGNSIVPSLDRWKYSPIVSVNLWYDQDVLDKMMVGFLGSRFQWVFDKKFIIKSEKDNSYISLLISAADSEISMKKEEIAGLADSELRKFFPSASTVKLNHYQVIKEQRATVDLTPEMLAWRPANYTRIKNLYLAGDWTDTPFPATIESAVTSGFAAADLIISSVEG